MREPWMTGLDAPAPGRSIFQTMFSVALHFAGSDLDVPTPRPPVGRSWRSWTVCADGGWNYGNSEVFGQALPAHVPPTAGAVLALQDHPNDALLTRAAAFLEVHALQEGSTTSLALSALALRMLNRDVSAITGRLAAHVPSAIAFGNAAALAMAACALGESALQDALRLPTSPAR